VRLAPLLAILVVLVAAPAASGYYQMPIYSLSPANGSTFLLHPPAGYTRINFTSLGHGTYSDFPGDFSITVRRDARLGADGTLSDDSGQIESGAVTATDASSNSYSATLRQQKRVVDYIHYDYPGKYYFQFKGRYNYSSGYAPVASPIFYYNLVDSISAPSAPGGVSLYMSSGNARVYLKRLIKEHFHRRARHLHAKCKRTSDHSFRCSARFWRGKKYQYRGRFRFRHGIQDDDVVWYGTFKGARARRSCLRHHKFGRCDRRVKWSD
jgi:hypothetical protein